MNFCVSEYSAEKLITFWASIYLTDKCNKQDYYDSNKLFEEMLSVLVEYFVDVCTQQIER